MPFKKGQSGNPNGRGKGVQNKITAKMKDDLVHLIARQIPNIEKALDGLIEDDKKAYLQTLHRYMDFVIAKKRDLTSNEKELFSTLKIIYDKNNTPESNSGVRQDSGGEEKEQDNST